MFSRPGGTKAEDLELCGFISFSQKTEIFLFVLKNASICRLRYETPYSGKIDVTITQNEAYCEDEKYRQSLVWDPKSRQGKIKSPGGGSLPPGDYIFNNRKRTVYHQSENYDEVTDAPVRRYEGAKMTVGVSQAFGECMKNNPTQLFCEYCRLPDNIQPSEDFTELTVRMNEPNKQYVYNIGCWIDVGWPKNITYFTKVNFYEAEKQERLSQEQRMANRATNMAEEKSTNLSTVHSPITKKKPTEDRSRSFNSLPMTVHSPTMKKKPTEDRSRSTNSLPTTVHSPTMKKKSTEDGSRSTNSLPMTVHSSTVKKKSTEDGSRSSNSLPTTKPNKNEPQAGVITAGTSYLYVIIIFMIIILSYSIPIIFMFIILSYSIPSQNFLRKFDGSTRISLFQLVKVFIKEKFSKEPDLDVEMEVLRE